MKLFGYSMWKEWKIIDLQNVSWTVYEERTWEDLDRDGKTFDPKDDDNVMMMKISFRFKNLICNAESAVLGFKSLSDSCLIL
jgi:hypothetical protein